MARWLYKLIDLISLWHPLLPGNLTMPRVKNEGCGEIHKSDVSNSTNTEIDVLIIILQS